MPAINKIAHEYVAGVGRVAAGAKQLLQIIVLPVYVAAHGHGRLHQMHIGLLYQIVEHDVAQATQVVLGQVFALFRHLDPFVDVGVAAAAAAARHCLFTILGIGNCFKF